MESYSVSVKAVVRDLSGRWLVLQRSNLSRNNPLLWDLPGGKLDPGEDVATGVARELREETRMDATAIRYAATVPHRLPSRTILYLVFHVEVADNPCILSAEHCDFRFESPQNLLKNAHELAPSLAAILSLLP